MKKIDFLILLLGAIFPIILRFLVPNIYHFDDVGAFVGWAQEAEHFKDLYASECFCNYPVIGLLSSTGLMRIVNSNIAHFLLALTIFDFVNVFLFYSILKRLKVNRAALWAGLIGLLPSTWVGGSFWGQIDHIGQLILLLSILTTLWFQQKKIQTNKSFIIYLAIISILFGLALLTKQLLLFSLFPLSVMVLIFIFKQSSLKPIQALKYIGICFVFTFAPIFLFDVWLNVPEPYLFSHLERVFSTGSGHMNKISGNGFNIWILLGRDMWSSSDIPFYKSLTPKNTGLFLFLAVLIAQTIILINKLKQNWNIATNTDLVVLSLFYLALVNLSFNLFLSGTHERYLFHFYPFILMALLATRNYIGVGLSILGAGIYGCFVFTILYPKWYQVGDEFTLLCHGILFIYLIYIYATLAFNSNQNLQKIGVD